MHRCVDRQHEWTFWLINLNVFFPFSALALLVWWHEWHPVCKIPLLLSPKVPLQKKSGRRWPRKNQLIQLHSGKHLLKHRWCGDQLNVCLCRVPWVIQWKKYGRRRFLACRESGRRFRRRWSLLGARVASSLVGLCRGQSTSVLLAAFLLWMGMQAFVCPGCLNNQLDNNCWL